VLAGLLAACSLLPVSPLFSILHSSTMSCSVLLLLIVPLPPLQLATATRVTSAAIVNSPTVFN
jgi:hypothetical protein